MLKEGLDSLDLFKIYNSIANLKDDLSLSTAPFYSLKDKLTALLPDANKFVDEYGSDVFSYYMYHYGSLFSEKEISIVKRNPIDMSKSLLTYERLEEEDFLSYLERTKSIDNTDRNIIKEDTSKVRDFWFLSPEVHSLYLLLSSMKEDKKFGRTIVNDLVYYSSYLSEDTPKELLGIKLLKKEDLKDIPKVPSISYDKFSINFLLENVIYPVEELNEIVSGDSTEFLSIHSYKDSMVNEWNSMLESMKRFSDRIRG
jgi:hypothetical protein